MLDLQTMRLPDYFTLLLRINMQSSGKNFASLDRYVYERAHFRSLVSRYFSDVDPKVRIPSIVKSLGWHGFRDRLANIFLEKMMSGKFPQHTKLDHVKEILEFEERVKKYTVDGYSRSFLLAFYLKSYLIWEMSEGGGLAEFDQFQILSDVGQALELNGSRAIKIDWIILSLCLYSKFLGQDILVKELKSGKKFSELFQLLDDNQKRDKISNMLSYGASIGEQELFTSDRV